MPAQRISLFPLTGALLFPGMQLPLHIFEPRYRGLCCKHGARPRGVTQLGDRSEEHTSELQSLMRISYAVFCLKKKNKKNKSRFDIKRKNTSHTSQTTTHIMYATYTEINRSITLAD